MNIINFKWNDIYETILKSESNRKIILDFLKSEDFEKKDSNWILKLFSFRSLTKRQTERLIRKYNENKELISFLKKYSKEIDDDVLDYIREMYESNRTFSKSILYIPSKDEDDIHYENMQKDLVEKKASTFGYIKYSVKKVWNKIFKKKS